MAPTLRLAGRTSSLLRQIRAPARPARSFTTRSSTRCLYAKTQAPANKNAGFVRVLSSSAVHRADVQSAPSARAYVESGVVKGAANPVDVKKVLVIGSGGLSIGQAGEFDYSGQWFRNESPEGILHSDPSEMNLIFCEQLC
jgi:carbamoyl-phosphate synthase large subunit